MDLPAGFGPGQWRWLNASDRELLNSNALSVLSGNSGSLNWPSERGKTPWTPVVDPLALKLNSALLV